MTKKTNRIIFCISVIALLVFDLYKAYHSSFTHDESYTYLYYVNTGVMDIISYKDYFTNNHILNTLLMKFFQALFGSSEIVLRLPNILAHFLYLFFTYKLFDRYCAKSFIVFFILANANPYLLDFFSLARGYGLAIGLMSAGLYYYCRYIESQKQRYHVFSFAFIAVASIANFALINVLLILILVHNIFEFFIFHQRISMKNIWKANRVNLLIAFLLLIIVYEPIRKILKYKLLDFGGIDGFWTDTVGTLVNSFSYHSNYGNVISVVLKVFIIFISLLFVLRSILLFSGKAEINLTQKVFLFFGMILFLIVLSSNVQHLLFGTPFLMDRFAVFLFPLFIFLSSFLIFDSWYSKYKYLIRSLLFLLAVMFFCHTAYSINTSRYYEWEYDMNTKKMLQELNQIRPKTKSHISLGITWFFDSAINFYRKKLQLDWLNEVGREGLKAENDYYYISESDINKISPNEIKIIKCYPHTKNYLLQNLRKIQSVKLVQLKAVNNKYVCVDGMLNDTVIANREIASIWETFSLIIFVNGECAIKGYNEHYFSMGSSQKNEISAVEKTGSSVITFTLVPFDADYVAFKAANGKYLSFDEKTLKINASGKYISDKEKFKMINK